MLRYIVIIVCSTLFFISCKDVSVKPEEKAIQNDSVKSISEISDTLKSQEVTDSALENSSLVSLAF